MKYEMLRDNKLPNTWRVEAIDYDHEGAVYVTLFSGPAAEARAKEYANWMNQRQKKTAA